MSTTEYVNVDRDLNKLSETAIKSDNIQALHDFVNHCAAEGISEVQQSRLLWSWKTMLKKFSPTNFTMRGADETELKQLLAAVNRSDYADSTKVKFKTAVKKFYRIENGGREQPEKTLFFKVGKEQSSISREDLFTEDELKRLFSSFSHVRDRAFTMMMYESAARPGELLARNMGDFTSNDKGDFIYLEGLKGTPDRTNQLVRSGRSVREWLMQHPLGGELGDLKDPSAPLWVKMGQQKCTRCGNIPQQHSDDCDYEPNLYDRLQYRNFYKMFKKACRKADIPENKTRPYNLRHTRLTEVATFMGYEQLNKFAGWKPGSDRAKVYVHLNNDDVNKAIREKYGLSGGEDEETEVQCPFCSTVNQTGHSECRTCGRPLSIQSESEKEEKQDVLERLSELEEKGVLDKLDQLDL